MKRRVRHVRAVWRFLVLGAVAVVASCAAPTGGTPSGGKDAAADRPVLLPDTAVIGRVASVNPSLRFVVMEFPLRRVPSIDQRLNVYREGRKIGEVKVTGPAVETTIAGDITEGTVLVGDEVRED